MKITKKFKKLFFIIYSKFFIRIKIKEGFLKKSGGKFRCLFVNDSSFNQQLALKIFQFEPEIIENKRILIHFLRKYIESVKSEIDLCIAELPEKYEKKISNLITFKSKGLVSQFVYLNSDKTRSKVKKRLKEIERIIRKYDLKYQISYEIEDLKWFYENMYLPYAKKRFNNFANIEDFEKMIKIFKKGFLLFIIKENLKIAGSLNYIKDKVFIGHKIGVLNGNLEYLKFGTLMANYYYSYRYAEKNNINKIDLGESLSILDDKIFLHKREFGAEVFPYNKGNSWIYYCNVNPNKRFIYFLEECPIISYSEKGLIGMIGNTQISSFKEDIKNMISKKYYSPGLAIIKIIQNEQREPYKIDYS